MARQEGTTLDEAAAQIFSVETTLQPLESENAAFERAFRRPELNKSFGWRPGPHLIRNYQVLDAVLDGAFRGLFKANGFIRGTGYLVPDEHMMSLGIDQANLVRASDDSTVVMGCNTAYANYFHWITQALPAIDFTMRRIGNDRNVTLALPILNSWQEESLRLLGYHAVKRVVIDSQYKQYFFHRIEYSDILNDKSVFSLSETTHQTYSRLRTAVELEPAGNRKIYVARSDAQSRRMRNEAEVIAEARKRGFEIIVPGDLTLTEQIRLFRGASMVMGTHGAGLTNVVFCEPGTIVYELRPAHYPNACFCNLAYICRLRYWVDDFESEGEGLPNLREWESDTQFIVERLDEVEAIHAQLQEQAKLQTISAMDFLRGKVGQVADLRTADEQPVMQAPPGLLLRLRRMIVGR